MGLNDFHVATKVFGVSDAAITTTAKTLTIPPLVARTVPIVREMKVIAPTGNTDLIYVAANGAVADATGLRLNPGESIILRGIQALSAIAATGTQTVVLSCQA